MLRRIILTSQVTAECIAHSSVIINLLTHVRLYTHAHQPTVTSYIYKYVCILDNEVPGSRTKQIAWTILHTLYHARNHRTHE